MINRARSNCRQKSDGASSKMVVNSTANSNQVSPIGHTRRPRLVVVLPLLVMHLQYSGKLTRHANGGCSFGRPSSAKRRPKQGDRHGCYCESPVSHQSPEMLMPKS